MPATMLNSLTGSLSRSRKTFRLALLSLALFNTGCMTTLGYVPEYPKAYRHHHWWSTADFDTEVSLSDVKAWATNVMDGYDTRATLNRHAVYGGALLAGTGAASLVGLAALGGDTAWITGIPIGTAFLSGVFALYSNDTKAEIYSLATNYLQHLLNNSTQRQLLLEKDKTGAINRALINAQAEVERLQKEIDAHTAKIQAEAQQGVRTPNSTSSPTAKNGAPSKPETGDVSKKTSELVTKVLNHEVERLNGEKNLALQRVTAVKRLQNLTEGMDTGPACNTIQEPLPTTTPRETSTTNDSENTKYCAKNRLEATCLRDDVMEVMDRVDRLLIDLTPANVSDSLNSVGTTTGKTRGDWVQKSPLEQAKEDLVFLQSSIVSKCGVF